MKDMMMTLAPIVSVLSTVLAQASTVTAAPASGDGVSMPHFDRGLLEVVLYSIAGVALIIAGYRLGRLVGKRSAMKAVQQKEQELFTAQKGFKNLYEMELAHVRAENDELKARAETMNVKVEEYRKKAAG
jgi:hypothetical protein